MKKTKKKKDRIAFVSLRVGVNDGEALNNFKCHEGVKSNKDVFVSLC